MGNHFIGVKTVVFDVKNAKPIFILDDGRVMAPKIAFQGESTFLHWEEDKETMLAEMEAFLEK